MQNFIYLEVILDIKIRTESPGEILSRSKNDKTSSIIFGRSNLRWVFEFDSFLYVGVRIEIVESDEMLRCYITEFPWRGFC